MRPTWDQYFLQIANLAAARSTCFSPPKGAENYPGSEAIEWFNEVGVKVRKA